MRNKLVACLGLLLCVFGSVVEAQFTGSGQKVAVLDSGLFADALIPPERIDSQFCLSAQDILEEGSTNATDGFVHYKIASTCNFGSTSDFTRPTAAMVPRQTEHNFTDIYDFHYFGNPHGSYVTRKLLQNASNAKVIAINHSAFLADREALISPGLSVPCGPHGPGFPDYEDVPIEHRPTRRNICYGNSASTLENQALISRVLSRGNVAAINISSGSTDIQCSKSNSDIRSIVNQGVAIVAAAGNGGPGARIGWPACNPNVLTVGNGDLLGGGRIISTTSTGGQIDFFASGEIIEFDSGTQTTATSFSAPVVAAAFASLREARPTATIAEIIFALNKSAQDAGKTIPHLGARVPFIDQGVIQVAAQCLAAGTCVSNDDGIFDDIDYSDTGEYGPANGDLVSANYTFDVDFNNLAINSASSRSSVGSRLSSEPEVGFMALDAPNQRDVVISFDGMSNVGSGSFKLYINNRLRKSTPSFSNQRSFEFVFKRELFTAGNNTIRIEPSSGASQWGLSNVKANFTPIVELTLNELDRNDYGSEETPERPTGMRVAFELNDTSNDAVLAVTGYSIDSDDKLTVYLNGKDYGNLTRGAFAQYGSNDFLILEKEDLVEGRNMIEFVQKAGTTRWGVRDLLVSVESTNAPVLALGQINQNKFGRNYGSNENPADLNVSFVPMSQHDHKVSWRAFDIDVNDKLEVYLNGTFIKRVNGTANNSLGSTESITLAWRLFRPGVNLLSFRVNGSILDQKWGMTDLLVGTSSIIDLDKSVSFNKKYGYFENYLGEAPAGWNRAYSGEDYQTRLYARFSHEGDGDRTLSLKGWDVDSAEELAVYLNGRFLRYVTSANISSVFSTTDRIKLPEQYLLQGINLVSFRTKDENFGFNNEKWGVEFIRLSVPRSSLNTEIVPILMMILDD